MFRRHAALLALLVGVAEAGDDVSLQCLDGNGEKVDSWYIIKQPGGWAYDYIADGHPLQRASDQLSDKTSPVFRTMSAMYNADWSTISYALWNDQHPDGKRTNGPRAHAKGLIGLQGDLGFWITHSVPRFPRWTADLPPFTNEEEEKKYAQSFLCITIDKSALETVGAQKTVDWVSVYSSKDGSNVGEKFTNWAVDDVHVKKKTLNTSITTLTSKGGQKFTSFAKSAYWQDDLWDHLIAPHFKKDFITETWQNGAGRMASNCDGDQKVYNVVTVQFPGDDAWQETQSHSKWGVSTDGDVFCVGDINRQTGQRNRGGGATCIESSEVGKQMLKLITAKEECDSKNLTGIVTI